MSSPADVDVSDDARRITGTIMPVDGGQQPLAEAWHRVQVAAHHLPV
jgi:hypothetical protein